MKRFSLDVTSVVSKTRVVRAESLLEAAAKKKLTTFTSRQTGASPKPFGFSGSAVGSAAAANGMFAVQNRTHLDVLTGDRTKPPMKLTFVLPPNKEFPNGEEKEITCYEGQNLLEIAQEHHLPMEGACAGSCACSTCHVYLNGDGDYDSFPEPDDKEYDMLDLAFFPTATSRLGCQLFLKREHDGMRVTFPKATRNMAVDGFVATPH